MTSRRLYQRVEEPVASRLHVAALALLELRVEGRASRIYINEIAEAIEQGLLLAAIELATTLLEIWVRDLLVIRRVTQTELKHKRELEYSLTKIDREIEGYLRGQMFGAMCNDLLTLKVIDQDEFHWLQSIYQQVRTPLHHGISGRIVDPGDKSAGLLANATSREEMLLASIFGSAPHQRANDLEDFIYDSAADILEGIVNFLGAHQIPRVGR